MSGSAPVATLEGWRQSSFTGAGYTHDCYEKGSGPGVVLIPEMPGMTPEVMGLGEFLVARGFTVVVPSPFGIPGKAATAGYTLNTMRKVCVSAEFRAFALNAHRPITDYLRAVAADLASRTPGKGVGVIGECFTGGFALATAIESSVLASVMSQPAVPFPTTHARKIDLGASKDDVDAVTARTEDGSLCLMGLRFSGDVAAPEARFVALKARLGDAFEVIELDSSKGNADGYARGAHSVLTSEVRENPANSAFRARDRMVEFLRERISAA